MEEDYYREHLQKNQLHESRPANGEGEEEEDRKNKCVRQDRKIGKGVKKPKRKKAEFKMHFR